MSFDIFLGLFTLLIILGRLFIFIIFFRLRLRLGLQGFWMLILFGLRLALFRVLFLFRLI